MPTPSAVSEVKSPKHLQMMAAGIGCAVTVRSESGKTSPGVIRIQEWDKKARTQRALRFWLYCWAASLLSIAIPVAHFILVPGLFLAGPAGAWIVSTQSVAILGGESVCPECGAFLPLSSASDSWPINDLCSACQHRVKIEKA